MASNYTVEELLLDESFTAYCLHPSKENSRKWEQLIAEQKITPDVIDEARSILMMLNPQVPAEEKADEVNKLRQLLAEREQKQLRFEAGDAVSYAQPYAVKKGLAGKLLVAGSIAASLAIMIFFIWGPSTPEKAMVIGKFITGIGERKEIRLPDGSIVILSSNSTLVYEDGYNNADRKVRLDGNAFFKVASNPQKPFSVYSDGFSTTALGTSFYVSSDSMKYAVKLLEGKVKINSQEKDKSAILYPGEEVLWDDNNSNFTKRGYDTVMLNNWLTGRIVFQKTPVEEAFAILRDWYGVEIVDNRQNRENISINGTYEHVLLEDILKVICFTLNCEAKYDHQKIIIQ